jgi:hypothetical protein
MGCYRAYPPTRPSSVPAAAVWAGGLDGGGWVTCSSDFVEYNVCTIWDEEGRTRGPAHYTLKDARRAATIAELKYTYLTGEAIGLESNLELRRVSPQIGRPLGSERPRNLGSLGSLQVLMSGAEANRATSGDLP